MFYEAFSECSNDLRNKRSSVIILEEATFEEFDSRDFSHVGGGKGRIPQVFNRIALDAELGQKWKRAAALSLFLKWIFDRPSASPETSSNKSRPSSVKSFKISNNWQLRLFVFNWSRWSQVFNTLNSFSFALFSALSRIHLHKFPLVRPQCTTFFIRSS